MTATPPTPDCARYFWDKIIAQDEATTALQNALAAGNLGQAYLFVGERGLGKIHAARAIAARLMCEDGGCGNCHICTRLERNTHPDFHILEPAGKAGWLVEQIRELNYDINLSPVEANHKLYVLRDSDLLNASSANAFLKTLEEPPPKVTLILLAHTSVPVLPTIRSRCQILRFHPLPPENALELLRSTTGCERQAARIALAAAGNAIPAARDYLASPKQQAARIEVLKCVRDLRTSDDLDILTLAKALMRTVNDPVKELRDAQEKELLERKELLDTVAIKQLEAYNKRRLSAFEQRSVQVILNLFTSLLTDCLYLSQGADDRVVNRDATELLCPGDSAGQAVLAPAAVARGVEAIASARRRLKANVGSQLVIETLLFNLQGDVLCPR